MSISPYKLIIFDWDGTLMDSADRIVSSMSSTAQELGYLVPSVAEIKNIIGLSLERAMHVLFGEQTEAQVLALIDTYRKYYLHLDTTPTPLFDGVLTTIEKLGAQGHLLAVATGKGIRGLERVLNETGLVAHFHSWRGADQARSKPDPLMLEQILDELNISASDALMVGDTSYDLEMAANIGMPSVGVSYGVHDNTTLDKYAPIAIIDDIQELLELTHCR